MRGARRLGGRAHVRRLRQGGETYVHFRGPNSAPLGCCGCQKEGEAVRLRAGSVTEVRVRPGLVFSNTGSICVELPTNGAGWLGKGALTARATLIRVMALC